MKKNRFAEEFASALKTIGNVGGSSFRATREGNSGEILILDGIRVLMQMRFDADSASVILISSVGEDSADAFVRAIDIMRELHAMGWNGRFRVRTRNN